VEELIEAGADTFIRVGTSGAIAAEARMGDVAIVTAAIR
jgi:uridine phosphorylase